MYMKYTKVKDLNLSDDVLLARDTISYVDMSLSAALSGINFQIRNPDTTPLRDVISDLSVCLQSIIARFGGKLNGQSITPDKPDVPDKPDKPDDPSLTKFFVMFCDYDDTVLQIQQIEEGHAATPPLIPDRDGYVFIGWDVDFSNVHESLVIHALYKEETEPVQPPSTTKYIVVFKDWDGSVLKQEDVEEGNAATPPANPTRDGYEFTGWSCSFADVRSDLTVVAQYKENAVDPGEDPIEIPDITYDDIFAVLNQINQTEVDWNSMLDNEESEFDLDSSEIEDFDSSDDENAGTFIEI